MQNLLTLLCQQYSLTLVAMKVFYFLCWVTFVAVVSVGRGAYADTNYSEEYPEYDYCEASDNQKSTGWFVPSENGSLYWVSTEEWDNTVEPQVSGEATFFLYTNLNPENPTQIYLNNTDGIIKSHFNVTNPTRFLIHGFLYDRFSEFPKNVREELLNENAYNVIVVDWSYMSRKDYITARWAVKDVGKRVAEFIDFLNMEIGMAFKDLTIIGHSLGAHVSGFAGKYVQNGKVDVIIGLDPAAPLFSFKNREDRLCDTDATYVETIQTSTILGLSSPVGKASFYPNGGCHQPGCELEISVICDHVRSYIYYAETIRWNNFRSMKCETRKDCYSQGSKSLTDERMGSHSNYGISGIFFVPVNKKSPHGTEEVP